MTKSDLYFIIYAFFLVMIFVINQQEKYVSGLSQLQIVTASTKKTSSSTTLAGTAAKSTDGDLCEKTPHTPPTKKPKRLLIVGGGIGGLSAAFDAKHNLHPHDTTITVLSDRKQFQFTPSNPWVSIRMRSPNDISLPLDEILPRHGINFVHGKAVHLDPKHQKVDIGHGLSLEYDYLIIATGPRLAFDEIDGAKTSTTLSVCTTPHASHTATEVDKLETDPGPIVVGATQGASCFGPAYEFAFLLLSELKKRGGQALVDQCPMTFVTPEPYVGHLGLKGAGTSKEVLQRLLKKNKVTYYTNCKINHVASNGVSITTTIDNEDERHKKTLTLPTKFTMLIPPFRGQHVWRDVPHLTNKDGMIEVNEYMQSPTYPNIFGVGVCVSIPPVEKTLVKTGAPKTGYMIESQGTAAVKNIRTMIDHYDKLQRKRKKILKGDDSTDETDDDDDDNEVTLRNRPLLNGVCITDFGHSSGGGAIFLTLPQYPPRRTDLTVEGKVATLAKIGFEKYFLHKIESGDTDPYYEKYMLHLIGVDRVTSHI
eukprot:CAMPEP_0113459114 /NCGR_PEP_ID=MMETSP0014_2-20120614/10280_1 /TAXON_ID=2857 /ORGANISM="Nitzschia sp." /LENGTH=536 /DNA_ID=CAMNT_0000350677 /DNA_START=258 /DNA_END=1868 /DNA_ORIENTATION=+ /assembly_acc=CAM_ASM_000159